MQYHELCLEIGISCIQLEGDAQTIINVVNSTAECEAWYGGIVEDVKFVLKQRVKWSFCFAHRGSNQVAHNLAKLGLSLDEERNLDGGHTPSISNVVNIDKFD